MELATMFLFCVAKAFTGRKEIESKKEEPRLESHFVLTTNRPKLQTAYCTVYYKNAYLCL